VLAAGFRSPYLAQLKSFGDQDGVQFETMDDKAGILSPSGPDPSGSENTVRYLGADINDALLMAERTEI
jgi:hypothetical protein